MNIQSNTNTGTSRKTWSHLFIGILSLQALLELAIGGTLLFNLPLALEIGFGITYTTKLDILGIGLGLYLLLLTTLMIVSAVWTYRATISGTTLGIIVGLFLVTFGVVSFFKFGNFGGILAVSIRGVVTLIFGYMAAKELKQQ